MNYETYTTSTGPIRTGVEKTRDVLAIVFCILGSIASLLFIAITIYLLSVASRLAYAF